ncbi:MAG: ABC transporter ATP-binding protein [Desulfobacteraceae bacterium]|nr:ABC transporter ATP-binding protein [Desulfobacteraceae bacterium]
MREPVLEVKGLETVFKTEEGSVPAVNGLDFSLYEGETLGIVGESGCGKSVAALSIMGLIPSPPGRVAAGQIMYRGEDLLGFSEERMRRIRGNQISMIFQEPMTALNPVYTVGNQIEETFRQHRNMSKQEAFQKSVQMLELVGIPLPEQRAGEYPHQLSGGMRQRVMIAMALACRPDVLIADEPTTALDVTIQAQILNLMKDLKKQFGTTIMLITHDLGVVAETAANVIVMYAGEAVEYAGVEDLFNAPRHPYTEGLLGSIPKIDESCEMLTTIEGVVPSLMDMPEGCRFHPRCHYKKELCTQKAPPLVESGASRVKCFKYTDQWPHRNRRTISP